MCRTGWVLLAVGLAACPSREELSSTPPDFSHVPDQESWNASLVTTREGRTVSKIDYAQMQRFSNKRLVRFLQGVHIALFDSSGAEVARVRAREGELNEVTRRIQLTGQVVVQAESGLVLTTDRLVWDEMKARITSDTLVTVVTADADTLFGMGFDSDRTLQNWTIRNPWGVSPSPTGPGSTEARRE